MAEQPAEHPPAAHDGRFGERFDDELKSSFVIQAVVGILVTCALGIVITLFLLRGYEQRVEATNPPPSPVVEAGERRLPEGPLLQAHPEAEYQAMLREMDDKLHGYGWADEARGVARIPIDKAIDVLVERGLGSAPPEPATAEGGTASE